MSGDRCFEAAKTIDELYSEVRDFDIVLCNDAPLATALNNRIDTAHLGVFAITPRQLASQLSVEIMGMPTIGDIPLVKRLSRYTGYGMRYVHGEVQNFKKAARYTSDIEPRLNRRSRAIYREYIREPTLDSLMAGFDSYAGDCFNGRKVAVIGLEMFDNLDKHMLPEDFTEIDLFRCDSDFSIQKLYTLGNHRQIADCAVDIAKRCGPADVAIVLDTSGPMLDALKTALYWNDIPFINALEVRDINSIRDYLEFLQRSLAFDTILVNDARQLLMTFGGMIPMKYGKYNISRFSRTDIRRSERLQELIDCMSSIRERTFDEVRRVCYPSGGKGATVSMVLDQMELKGSLVTTELLDDLVYAVNSIGNLQHNEQIPAEEKRGVLLTDCKNSVYIDRPVVVYTGLTDDWEVDLSDLDYIDPRKRPDIEEVNALRFKVLIQQGSVRFYLANATRNGNDAIPCKYFDKCYRGGSYSWDDTRSEPIRGFDQIPIEPLITKPWRTERKNRTDMRDCSSMGSTESRPRMFSNSSYMSFISCPKMYMLSRLSDSEDNARTYTGTKIHDYAEFRVSYPEMARENGIDYYADIIAEECALLSSPDLEGVERSRIRAALMAIDEFADGIGVEPGTLCPRPGEKHEDNIILKHHGLSGTSENTEVKFSSKDDAMEGIVDLLWDGMVYDYKTGQVKSPAEISRMCDVSVMREGLKKVRNGIKSCQALFYLCLLDDCDVPNRRTFNFLFVEEMYNRMLQNQKPNVSDCIRPVHLCETVEERYENHKTDTFDYKTYREHGWDPVEAYRICRDIAGPDPENWFIDDDTAIPAIAHAFEERFQKLGRNGNVCKFGLNVPAALRKLIQDTDGFIECVDEVVIMRSSVDEFRRNVLEDMERLRRYRREGFPANPSIDCGSCYYRDMCTMEKIDEEVDSDESE